MAALSLPAIKRSAITESEKGNGPLRTMPVGMPPRRWARRLPMRWAFALLATLLPSAVLADDLDHFARVQSEEKLERGREEGRAPTLDANDPSSTPVLSLHVEMRELVPHVSMPETSVGSHVKVELGRPKKWGLVSLERVVVAGPGASFDIFELSMDEFGPGETRIVTVQLRTNDSLCISLERRTPHGQEMTQLNEAFADPGHSKPGSCRLRWTDMGAGRATKSMSWNSSDFFALTRDHPVEVNTQLQPILRELGQETALVPDPILALEVLAPQLRLKSAISRKVDTLVAGLDAADFHLRDRSERDLAAMGRDAATVMMFLDRSTLGPEQNARLDRLLAPYLQFSIHDAEQLRLDPAFLLTCLYSDDLAVRTMAIARLRAVVKLPLNFDPNADASARAYSISLIMQQLVAAKLVVPKR
jgi:hypothetical protein